jgi:NADH-quinone oxidoreductase subunit E
LHSEKKCTACRHAEDTDFREIIKRFDKNPGNLIPVLHELQDRMGHLTAEAMEEVSDWLSVPLSEVYGTSTFYTMFSLEPKGENVIMLCDSPPCHIENSTDIRKALERELGIKPGGTSSDGMFTLEDVACLGCCSLAPVMMINGEAYGNLTPNSAREVIRGIYQKEKGGASK